MSVFHHGHKGLPIVTVSEETGNDDNKEFVGELLGEQGVVGGDPVWVRVSVTDADNTFGWSEGVTLQQLKHLGDGKYGA